MLEIRASHAEEYERNLDLLDTDLTTSPTRTLPAWWTNNISAARRLCVGSARQPVNEWNLG